MGLRSRPPTALRSSGLCFQEITTPAPKLATYADLEALADAVKAEIIDGVIETQPAPLPRHSKVQRVLGAYWRTVRR
ncbi:MAG: hypothetical protein RL701_4374 [Pseudomonadota bacterium]|jgi:Uma2 family endonuclease